MGCFDTILVPCPECGTPFQAQTKSGECLLQTYKLDEAPNATLFGIEGEACHCGKCGAAFEVRLKIKRRVVRFDVPAAPASEEEPWW